MVDNETNPQVSTVGGAPDASTAPQAGLITQYIKDFSFENPNAPASLQLLANQQPKIEVDVNVGVRQAQEDVYEVQLKIKASGKASSPEGQEVVAFVTELAYAGLFGIRNLPEEAVRSFMLVSAPTLLFPFARRVIADATRDGGFPPLLLDPMNFEALFRQQLAQEQAQAAQGGETAADAPAAESNETPDPITLN